MTIYIDSFYIVCSIMNFIILKIHSVFLSLKIKNTRLITGALLGGLISVRALVFGNRYIADIAATVLILRIVYGKCLVRELVRRFFVLMAIALMYGAMMNVFTVMCIGRFIKNRKMYEVLPIFVFFIGAGIGLAAVAVSVFFMKHKRNLYNIEMKAENETIRTKAFLDTGNGLCEPNTGKPVIIIEDGIIKGEHKRESIYLKTAARNRERLDMIKIDRITLLDENRVFEDLYAGISEQKLSKNGEFHVLLNSKF